VKGLIGARIRFGTINEWDLARLPNQARLLFVPAPFALSEEGYGHLSEFVRRGGTLYISGDFSFDESRKRTKIERLADLAGVVFVSERYPNVQYESAQPERVRYTSGLAYRGNPAVRFEPRSGTEVVATAGHSPVAISARGSSSSEGVPVAVRRSFGQGKVIFSADPAEFWPQSPLAALYTFAAREV